MAGIRMAAAVTAEIHTALTAAIPTADSSKAIRMVSRADMTLFSDFFGGFGYGSYGGYQTQVNPPQEQAGDSEPVRAAIRDILAGRYASACSILQNVPSTGRNARWYYLSGVANHGAGNQIQALEHMKRAVQLSPNNATYQALLRQYQQAGQTYQTNASGYNTWAMDPSKLCMSLCLLPDVLSALLPVLLRSCGEPLNLAEFSYAA